MLLRFPPVLTTVSVFSLLGLSVASLSGMARRPVVEQSSPPDLTTVVEVEESVEAAPTAESVQSTPRIVDGVVIVDSLEMLMQYADKDNVQVSLEPGVYWLTGPELRPAPEADYATFLDLSGDYSTYDFTGVTIKAATSELKGYGRAHGHGDTVRVLQVSGTGTTVQGLTLEMVPLAMDGVDRYGLPRQFTADWSTTLVEVIGDGSVVKDCEFTTGGSYPYGYGDAFGKGGRPSDRDGNTNAAWIDHRKQSGIRIGKGANGVTLENVTLNMRSFGHGIFMQEGASDIVLRNCEVLGDEMASSNDVIAHPEYQKWGFATYREKMPANIHLAKHEDGIRVYGPGKDYGRIKNVTVENCRVERMRDGLATGDMGGALIVKDTEVYDCEQGFTPTAYGSNRFSGCRGNATNGPLVFFRRSANNAYMEVELTGSIPPTQPWPVALISGYNNHVVLNNSAAPGTYPPDAYVMVSQHWREGRHRPSPTLDVKASHNVASATRSSTIINHTGQMTILGKNTLNNKVVSAAGIYDKGRANQCEGPAKEPVRLEGTDTWGTYSLGK